MFSFGTRNPINPKRKFPKISGAFSGSHNKDYSILGSILGYPYFWDHIGYGVGFWGR